MPDSNLTSALDQIYEIHNHMARNQVYRGYRPLPVAFSGLGGLAAAWVQPYFVDAKNPATFVHYWLAVAGISALIAGSAVLIHFVRQTPYERRQTLCVWGQFVPCLLAGALVGAGVARAYPDAIPLLPGLWAIIFSLGIFSSRPFLPKITGWVALFYLVAGTWMMVNPTPLSQPAWALALVFFIGQCAGAFMLYLKLERSLFHVEEQ